MPNGEMTGVVARRTIPLLYTLATLTLVTAILFWAKAVLMPLALAMLLAFLLDPVVAVCQRRGLPRVLAVLLVVVVGLVVLGALGWVVEGQVTGFTDNVQHYEDNLKRKIGDVRGAGKGSFLEKMETAAARITKELEGEPPAAGDTKPIPVVVQAPSLLWQLPTLLEPLATAGLVIALVIFMLLAQGDMRNRLIRLMGTGQLTLTTRALDEAGQRISRYLLMHTLVNGSHGTLLGIGLWGIGVPYALLLGVLAFLGRFIPYIGPVVSALVPVALSLVAFPGWTPLFLVVGFIVVLELLSNMVLEPLIYGRTAGISEVALMVAIAFWTWLWGPIGLLLATPLTVSLGVLGRYVPQLEFLGVLLSDDPALAPSLSYYQRLVAQDQDEATDLVEAGLRTQSLAETYETMLIPALSAAKKDQALDNLTADQMHFIVQATREIVEYASLLPPSNAPPATADAPVASAPETVLRPPVPIVAYPAHDEADEVALQMLRHLLDPVRYTVEVVPTAVLTGEVEALLAQHQASLLCVGGLAPGGMAQTRYLCKRLRAQLPALKIVVGRWGATDHGDSSHDLLRAAGADAIGTTLQETCAQLTQMAPLTRCSGQDALPSTGGGDGRHPPRDGGSTRER